MLYSQSKAQPKPATAAKTAAAGRRGRARPRKARNPANRKKTAEELDAEMVDYFSTNNENATTADANAGLNGAAQPAANGDAMDEISVSRRDGHDVDLATNTPVQ